MNFFIVQMRKLRLIDDKPLGESQSSWWSRDQTQEAAWLQSFIHPSPTPPASASCPVCCTWCKASSTPVSGSCVPTTKRDLPPAARVLRSGPGSALPAPPARKEGWVGPRIVPGLPAGPLPAHPASLWRCGLGKALGASQAATEGKHETQRQSDLSCLRRLRSVFPAASLSQPGSCPGSSKWYEPKSSFGALNN